MRVRGGRISSLTSGRGPEHVILIHGLGGAKSSFYETVSALTPDYTVHAIDLPGFGSSAKPLRAPYNAPYFARHVLRFMDTLAIDRAHLVGNSMGGRVAIEVGLEAPTRVRTLSLLAPSMAWLRGRGGSRRLHQALTHGSARSKERTAACSTSRSTRAEPRCCTSSTT